MSTFASNGEQEQVIQELNKNILLLASAGTGKTTTLAHRIAHCIDKGYAEPSQILCLTFTNKGAREITKALTEQLGAPVANKLYAGTFHSFCYKILRDEGKEQADFYQDLVIFDEEECKELIKSLLEQYVEEEKSRQENAYRYLFALSKKNIVGMTNLVQLFMNKVRELRGLFKIYGPDDLDDFKETLQRITKSPISYGPKKQLIGLCDREFKNYTVFEILVDLMPSFIVTYEQLLRESHGMDFIDLIIETDKLFQNPAIVNRWRHTYRYIHIDEVQDTSELEYRLLEPLMKGNHILLCGDFFQTIYEWRGSVPETILSAYKEQFEPQVIVFYENYRATQNLFRASWELLSELFGQETLQTFYAKVPHTASREQGEPILFHGAANPAQEAQYIYESIKRQRQGTSCILVRQNNTAQELAAMMAAMNAPLDESQKLPFMVIDDFNFYRRMEIKDILAFLKLAANEKDALSAKRIIEKFIPGVGPAKMKALESEDCRRTGLRLPDFLRLRTFEKDPYEDLIKNLEWGHVVVFDVESTGVDTTSDEIIQIAAIRIDKEGRLIDSFERFISPSKPVGDSEAVHGFSDAYLAEMGEEATLVFEAFKAFAKDAVVVGHNVQYDIQIFTSELARHHLGAPAFGSVYDTLDLYRRFYPNEKKHTLEYLSRRFQTRHKPSHNAMDDILATAELLVAIVEKHIIPTRDKRLYYLQNKQFFAEMASRIETLQRKSYTETPAQLIAYIMTTIGLKEMLLKEGKRSPAKAQEAAQRLANTRNLYRRFESIGIEYHHLSPRDLLIKTLQIAALTATELQPHLLEKGVIPILTVHQSKGSEFDYVYLAGVDDNKFPSFMAQKEGRYDEEKRLFYVALTRARRKLTITYSKFHKGYNQKPSRYIQYIPQDLIRSTP